MTPLAPRFPIFDFTPKKIGEAAEWGGAGGAESSRTESTWYEQSHVQGRIRGLSTRKQISEHFLVVFLVLSYLHFNTFAVRVVSLPSRCLWELWFPCVVLLVPEVQVSIEPSQEPGENGAFCLSSISSRLKLSVFLLLQIPHCVVLWFSVCCHHVRFYRRGGGSEVQSSLRRDFLPPQLPPGVLFLRREEKRWSQRTRLIQFNLFIVPPTTMLLCQKVPLPSSECIYYRK